MKGALGKVKAHSFIKVWDYLDDFELHSWFVDHGIVRVRAYIKECFSKSKEMKESIDEIYLSLFLSIVR